MRTERGTLQILRHCAQKFRRKKQKADLEILMSSGERKSSIIGKSRWADAFYSIEVERANSSSFFEGKLVSSAFLVSRGVLFLWSGIRRIRLIGRLWRRVPLLSRGGLLLRGLLPPASLVSETVILLSGVVPARLPWPRPRTVLVCCVRRLLRALFIMITGCGFPVLRFLIVSLKLFDDILNSKPFFQPFVAVHS